MQPLASQNLFLYSGKKNYILVFNKICALVSFVDSGHKLLSQTMATNRLYITPRMLCSSSASDPLDPRQEPSLGQYSNNTKGILSLGMKLTSIYFI